MGFVLPHRSCTSWKCRLVMKRILKDLERFGDLVGEKGGGAERVRCSWGWKSGVVVNGSMKGLEIVG